MKIIITMICISLLGLSISFCAGSAHAVENDAEAKAQIDEAVAYLMEENARLKEVNTEANDRLEILTREMEEFQIDLETVAAENAALGEEMEQYKSEVLLNMQELESDNAAMKAMIEEFIALFAPTFELVQKAKAILSPPADSGVIDEVSVVEIEQ